MIKTVSTICFLWNCWHHFYIVYTPGSGRDSRLPLFTVFHLPPLALFDEIPSFWQTTHWYLVWKIVQKLFKKSIFAIFSHLRALVCGLFLNCYASKLKFILPSFRLSRTFASRAEPTKFKCECISLQVYCGDSSPCVIFKRLRQEFKQNWSVYTYWMFRWFLIW